MSVGTGRAGVLNTALFFGRVSRNVTPDVLPLSTGRGHIAMKSAKIRNTGAKHAPWDVWAGEASCSDSAN